MPNSPPASPQHAADVTLPASCVADAVVAAPATVPRTSMRSRFIRTLSIPLALDLPGDAAEQEAGSLSLSGPLAAPGLPTSGLHCLIIPLANGTGSGVAPLRQESLLSPGFRSPNLRSGSPSLRGVHTPRSLTPPPYASSPESHAATLMQPFSYAFGSKAFLDTSSSGAACAIGAHPAGPPSTVACNVMAAAFATAAAQDGVQASGAGFGVAAHQGSRPSMQDSFTCRPVTKTFAVCDGHGKNGHIVAALSTAMLPGLVQHAIAAHSGAAAGGSPGRSVPDAMRHAFAQMDAHLLRHTNQGGSTALLAHIAAPSTVDGASSGAALYLAHVGDTRAVLCSGGVARALTRDHKPEHPEERRAIEAKGGAVVLQQRGNRKLAMENAMAAAASSMQPNAFGAGLPPMVPPSSARNRHSAFNPFSSVFDASASASASLPPTPAVVAPTLPSCPSVSCTSTWRVDGQLNLSRSLGDHHLKHIISAQPDVSEREISPQDEFVILATDGLWGVMSDAQAVSAVQQFMQADAALTPQLLSGHRTPQHIHSLAARAADHLAALALQQGSQDNVCVLILMLQQLIRTPAGVSA
jgi:serine/threonine protein phosphatase PrpC